MEARDGTLDTLLDLDDQVFIVDEAGEYWVKFRVRRVAMSPETPWSGLLVDAAWQE